MVVIEDMATLRSDQSAKQPLYKKGEHFSSFKLRMFSFVLLFWKL